MPQEEATNQQSNPQAAVAQARQIHAQLDGMRQWSRENAARFEERARLIEEGLVDAEEMESPEELRQVAEIIRSVATRVEQGDVNKVRQVDSDGEI